MHRVCSHHNIASGAQYLAEGTCEPNGEQDATFHSRSCPGKSLLSLPLLLNCHYLQYRFVHSNFAPIFAVQALVHAHRLPAEKFPLPFVLSCTLILVLVPSLYMLIKRLHRHTLGYLAFPYITETRLIAFASAVV